MVVSTETWIRAQESVLGACLIDDRCVIKIVFALTESDFCETYRTIYRAMHDLYTTGKAVDPVTILAVIGPQYKDVLAQLMEITPTAANVDAYVEIVLEQSRILQLRQVGLRLNEINDVAEGNEILAAVASQTVKDSDDIWSLSDGLHDWMARYRKKPEYLDWFLPQMRRMLLGEKSDYYILGGRPSSGKSAFAVQAAVYWAVICRKRVGFFSHETSREKIMDRLVACAAGVPLKAMKERTLSDKDLEAVCAMTAKINEAPLYTIKAAGKTAAQIREVVVAAFFTVVNSGQVPVPFTATIVASGEVVNPKILSVLTGETLQIKKTLEAGERLEIRITHERTYVTSSIDGECRGALSLQSNLYRLAVGNNILKPDADSGKANMQINIDYATEIVGIAL